MKNETLPVHVQDFISILQDRLDAKNAEYKLGRSIAMVETGTRFYKVVIRNDRGSGSVHAFIDKDSLDLYKAAGWRGPAKGVRFNLVNDRIHLERVIDTYGSYLYKR